MKQVDPRCKIYKNMVCVCKNKNKRRSTREKENNIAYTGIDYHMETVSEDAIIEKIGKKGQVYVCPHVP